jgi:CheY-like chemotaxis protein
MMQGSESVHRVLVVDDDKGVCSGLRRLISKHLPVVVAYDLAAAMAEIAKPGLVGLLTDLNLGSGVEDGFRVARAFLARFPRNLSFC